MTYKTLLPRYTRAAEYDYVVTADLVISYAEKASLAVRTTYQFRPDRICYLS